MEMQARLEQGPRKKEPELTEFLHRVRGCFSQLSPNFRVVLFVPGGGLHPASPWGTKLDGVSGQRKHLSSGKSFSLLVPSLLLIAFSSSRCLLRKHLLECFFLLNSNQFVQIIAWISVHQVHPDICHLYRNQKFL